MGYDNYLTLLQNACIRYDSNLKSRPSPASRAAYQHELSHDQHDNPYPQDYYSTGTTYGGIDMPVQKYSTRSTLPTLIGPLMYPPLPLGSLLLPLLLVDPLPGGLLSPSFFLPTYTNF